MNFDRVIRLTHGAGNGVDTACLLTAANMLVGKGELKDGYGEGDSCVCWILRPFIVLTNDNMSEDFLGEVYGPLVYEILGTKIDYDQDSRDVLLARAKHIATWTTALATIVTKAFGEKQTCDGKLIVELCRDKSDNANINLYDAGNTMLAEDFKRMTRNVAVAAGEMASLAFYLLDGDDLEQAAGSETTARGVAELCAKLIRDVAAIGDQRPKEQAYCLTPAQLADKLVGDPSIR